jgi:hypothetical protein
MKKTLLSALLIVSAASATCLGNAVKVQDRAYEITREIAAPLFWHLWDEFLRRELSRGARSAANVSEEASWRPQAPAEAVGCVLLHVLLRNAFDSVLSVAARDHAFAAIPSKILPRAA